MERETANHILEGLRRAHEYEMNTPKHSKDAFRKADEWLADDDIVGKIDFAAMTVENHLARINKLVELHAPDFIVYMEIRFYENKLLKIEQEAGVL